MDIQILGCSGGLAPGCHTTSFLINDRLLIDAGTGIGTLALERMGDIDDVVLTHSHLDHVCGLAFLVDNLFERRAADRPLSVHALPVTLKALREHLFNGRIWPDFSKLPTPANPVVQWCPIGLDAPLVLPHGLVVTALPVSHTVPAVGYAVADGQKTFAFSGDTHRHPPLWDALNRLSRLDVLMIEVAFPNQRSELAQQSRHLTPAWLASELTQLRHHPRLWLTHAKPGAEAVIAEECATALAGWDYIHLKAGDVLEI